MTRLIKNKFPEIDIFIIHINGEKIIKNLLKSLKKINYPNYNILVLLNGTTDNSEKIIKKYNVKIFKSKKIVGFVEGCYKLLDYSLKNKASKYFYLLNDDMEVDKNFLKEIVNFAEENNISICSSKIRNLKEKNKFDYGGAAGGFIDKYGYSFCRGRIFDSIEKDRGQYDKPTQIFYASGGGMLVKKELVKKIGFFDKDYFTYSEEVDFCWRANLYGEKIFYVPSSVVYHLGHFTFKKEKWMDKKEYLLHRNTLITFLKNYSDLTIIKLMIPRISLEIVSGIIFFPKKTIAILKSFSYIILNMKKIVNKRRKIQKLRKIKDDKLKNIILQKSIVIEYFLKDKKKFPKDFLC